MKTIILNGQEITIGTKLRFIDDRNLYPDNRDIIKIPELGEIYTVRGFNDIGGIYLKEIKNQHINFVNSEGKTDNISEPGFSIRRFEPAQTLSKKKSIAKKKIVQIEILPVVEERLEIVKKRKPILN